MALFGLLAGDRVSAFWRWFEKNAGKIEADVRELRQNPQARGASLLQMQARLGKVQEGLVHEIGSDLSGPVEIIISADGDLALFPAVTRVVSSAPPMPGVKVTAFRPRMGDAFALGMFGQQVTFAQVRYEAWPEEDKLGVKLHVAVNGVEGEELDAMAFILLDMALGEYDVATGLGTIEVAIGRPDNAKPLKDFAAEFDAYRRPSVH